MDSRDQGFKAWDSMNLSNVKLFLAFFNIFFTLSNTFYSIKSKFQAFHSIPWLLGLLHPLVLQLLK